ncbi:hypothetical protein Tco_0882088, partial [Tanacetum coccineum]
MVIENKVKTLTITTFLFQLSKSSVPLYSGSDVQAFYAQKFPISSPDPITPPAIITPSPIFEIGKCSDKMYLKHHEKQVEDILNYLDELSPHRIEKMEEGRINGKDKKDKSEQNQSKPTRNGKGKTRVKNERQSKAGSARYSKKRKPMKVKESMLTSLQSSRVHLDEMKIKGPK